jgi:hypothetical protein
LPPGLLSGAVGILHITIPMFILRGGWWITYRRAPNIKCAYVKTSPSKRNYSTVLKLKWRGGNALFYFHHNPTTKSIQWCSPVFSGYHCLHAQMVVNTSQAHWPLEMTSLGLGGGDRHLTGQVAAWPFSIDRSWKQEREIGWFVGLLFYLLMHQISTFEKWEVIAWLLQITSLITPSSDISLFSNMTAIRRLFRRKEEIRS